jgi:hypothetical protein
MERYQGKKVVIIGGTSGMGLDGGARVLGDRAVAGWPGFGPARAWEGRPRGFERRAGH